MKLPIKLIFSLLSSTAVFGSFLGQTTSADGLFDKVSSSKGSEKCISELTKFKNCIVTATKENLDSACNSYNTNECQAFYSNPLETAPSCENDVIIGTIFKSSIDIISLDLKFKCQKDENGKACPLAEVDLNNENASGEVISEAVKNSCKSRICRENALDILEYVNDINNKASDILQSSINQIVGAGNISEDNLNNLLKDQSANVSELQSYIDILKEDTCVAQSNASNATTSDANTSIKSVGTLFLSIMIILIYNYLY